MNSFQPPRYLANPHLQSILSSTGPRKFIVRQQASRLLKHSKTITLDLPQGARLQGQYARHPTSDRGLVILIHGWEGCADSLYLLSLGRQLFQHGYSVFRLNLRDHGDTRHLNRELFNSNRLWEAVAAVSEIQERFQHSQYYLGGFSLGGNFALRIALQAPEHNVKLHQVFAVCPVLDPADTMDQLDQGLFIYHDYFVHKWRRSLKKKLQFYPELAYGKEFLDVGSLRVMNEHFVPNYTGFANTEVYFSGYAVTGDALEKLAVETFLLTSKDDPICRAEQLDNIASTPYLTVEVTEHGGHCAYLQSFKFDSWADKRIIRLLNEQQR